MSGYDRLCYTSIHSPAISHARPKSPAATVNALCMMRRQPQTPSASGASENKRNMEPGEKYAEPSVAVVVAVMCHFMNWMAFHMKNLNEKAGLANWKNAVGPRYP